MDIKQIRRGNMLALIEREPSKAAFARKVGTDPAYISQILSKKTKAEVGNDLARAIESAYDLPHGWMDVAQVAQDKEWEKVVWLWQHRDGEIKTMFSLLVGMMYDKKRKETHTTIEGNDDRQGSKQTTDTGHTIKP